MTSEWMRVMLDEIARKKAESEQARIELERRASECVAPGTRLEASEEAPGGKSPSSSASE